MVTFTKAGLEETPLIEQLAQEIFRATYKEMLSGEQIDYMMDFLTLSSLLLAYKYQYCIYHKLY